MAAVQSRQPFGVLDEARLQKLTSVKNCQNAVTASLGSPSMKPVLASPSKRRLSITTYDEVEDAENIDPTLLNSPSKRSKNVLGTPVKPSRFILNPKSPARPVAATTTATNRAVSLSVPNTTTTTPISASRGSPKHKRVGLLAKNRRASSSPFRRIDPPSLSSSSAGLPFSIDEALRGTIPGFTSRASVAEPPMPKGWFFDIHEDTPEQEASNLMEHSAATLDISSDDDAATRRRADECDRGKENIPPPEDTAVAAAVVTNADGTLPTGAASRTRAVTKPSSRCRKPLHPDAMAEDRKPLGDLPAQDYCTAADAENKKLSALSKEFDFAVPHPVLALSPSKKDRKSEERTLPPPESELGSDEPHVQAQSKEIFICEDEL